ncbi:DUF4360 domain-containing protein [Oligoflexus tunisiensis]|uniref:DUF4360 domain-containing protein n=1 Tax=Oligoflexus tunisiensis TaxID=708132 RepID=UPI00114CBC25|nr:DUF4360 domain-containing protein [Oligoflexus tunisiensis]
MKVFGSIVKFVAPLLVLGAAAAHAEERNPVPSEPITIKKIQYNGTGCPLGTVAKNISEDKTAFTLTFSEFVAEAGPGISLSAGRKNCVATLVLDVPAGWQYSIGSFYFRGFMALDKGIRAEHSASYFLEGQGKTGTFSSRQSGPYENDYVFNDNVGISSAVWSPCGVERALNINTSIRVSNTNSRQYPNAQGLITNDSIDGQITQVWGLTWRRC